MKIFILFILLTFNNIMIFCDLPIYKELWYDFWETNYNMVSVDTLAIAGIVLPFYFLAKQNDNRLHSCFYDKHRHRNTREFHEHAHSFANHGQLAIVAVLASLGVLVSDVDIQSTSRMLWVGLPYTYGIKLAIRKIIPHGHYCLRPKNQHFSKHKPVHTGFPSGHMLEMLYITTLFWRSLGYKWGIPLTAYTAFMAVDFTVGNRHFVSQVVAGAAIGAAFGYASSKAVDDRICEKIQFSCSSNSIKLNYDF